MKNEPIIKKIRRKLLHLRLQPIRVFCFHQVSEQYDSDVYCKPDWVSSEFLKTYIDKLQADGYRFITLAEAHEHICKDTVRWRKYAVLTADDGLRCQADFAQWLETKKIPITLFLNTETLDGKTCGVQIKRYFHIDNPADEARHARALYLTKDDLQNLPVNVSIGSHGITHDDIRKMSLENFESQLKACTSELAQLSSYIPFYAYPYGYHTPKHAKVVLANNLTPVLAAGGKNYNDASCIQREIIDAIYKKRQVNM